MTIEIDKNAGFCFGVVNALNIAEIELEKNGELYCLGEIVHNNEVVNKLKEKGLKTISDDEYANLKNAKVLIRAHGAPPITYKKAKKNNITIIDATCPVVIKLQKKIREGYKTLSKLNGQIIIYGKKGHAEVIGLIGQTNGNAIVVSNVSDLDNIDYTLPIYLYSQTTQDKKGFNEIKEEISKRIKQKNSSILFKSFDTICHQVSNREKNLIAFAKKHNVILFVSDNSSSNGLYLYNVCKKSNKQTYFISNISDIKNEWFNNVKSVGITGATSTPMWLMENVSNYLKSMQQ